MKLSYFHKIVFVFSLVLAAINPAMAQKWTRLSSANGVGTTICNDSSNGHYSCFALRCGKGRGLEFAYLFSGGDIEDNRQVPIFVDNIRINTLKFNAIDPNSELVSAYDSNEHSNLLKALQSGKQLKLVFDSPNVFSLRNSSRQIKSILRQCAGINSPTDVKQKQNTNQNLQNFINIHMLSNTDIVGNDYASGLNVQRLAGLSRDQCQDVCISEQRCRAYTHNGDNNICILKDGVGPQAPFRNASSGIVSNRPKVAKPKIQVSNNRKTNKAITADLSWRGNDTRGTYLERIRKSAEQMGDSCELEFPKIEKVQNSVSISAKQQRQNVGETFELNWNANFSGNNLPVYLIVSTQQPVRFKGKGFYTLMPGALGPFGIVNKEANTRAIVPLFGSGVPQSGKINILPVFAGKVTIETSIIGYQRKCRKEVFRDLENIQLVALPSKHPKVVLDTRLVEATANEYIISPDKSRLLETKDDGSIRLLNAVDRQVVANISGVNPAFSVTGRFFSIGDFEYKRVYDSLDGKLIIDTEQNDLAWANNDSFLVFSTDHFGHVTAVNTLNPDTNFSAGGELAPRSSGLENGLRFDLENGYLIDNAKSTIRISRLYLPQQTQSTPGKRGRQQALTAKYLGKYFAVSPVHIPDYWSFVDGFKSPLRAAVPGEPKQNYLAYLNDPYDYLDAPFNKNSLIFPTRIRKSELAQLSIPQQASNTSVLRGISPDQSTSNKSTHRYLARLKNFGTPILDSSPIVFNQQVSTELFHSHGSARKPQKKLANLIAPKIIKDVPQFNKIMPATEEYGACDGRALDYARKHVINNEPVWIAHFLCTDGALDFFASKFMILDKSSPGGLAKFDLGDANSSSGVDCQASLEFCATKSAVFNDRYLTIWSKEARAFAIIDWEQRKLIHKKFNLPRGNTLERVMLLSNLDYLAQLNSDGTFFIYNLSANKIVLNGRIVDDEVIIWNDNLQFDSTAEGAHLVNLKFDGLPGKYTFQQFDSRLRVTGLLNNTLANQILPASPHIQVPPSLIGQIQIESNQIKAHMNASSLGELKSIRIYQDGVLTDEHDVNNDSEEISITVPRLSGARWVALVAVDENGLVSLPVGLDMGADAVAKPKVRLLAIGIDKYNNDGVASLQFAKSDSNTLADSLEHASGQSIDLASKTVLTNETASPADILAAAEKLVSDTKLGEQAVFFFAGHGVKGEDGRYYMATTQTDPNNISGTALSWDKLASVLAKSKARMSVFIDACHSGAAGTDFFATNDDAAEGILKSIPSGLTVFSASKGREFSEESAQIGGGYFTKAVAEVIAGNRIKYDTNNNGIIEVSELYVGVKQQVVKNTNGRQTPWLARNQMIGDFALF